MSRGTDVVIAGERPSRAPGWLYGLMGCGIGLLVVGLAIVTIDSGSTALGWGFAIVGLVDLIGGAGLLLSGRGRPAAD